MAHTRVRVLLLLALAAAGCGVADPTGSVDVRLENASSFTFDEATLYTSEGELAYTDVGPGEATPYVEVETAYRIATTQVVIGADTFRLQVIDFVGEEPLAGGQYSYVISVLTFGGQPTDLTQEIRQDP